MKPLVIFADPERVLIDYLKTALADDGATVSDSAPSTTLTATQKHVQVTLDGTPGDDYPLTDRATVRFTCYTAKGQRTSAKALASHVQAFVYVHPGSADVAGTTPLVGRSGVIADPDTQNLMVWFTFRVNLKPHPVAA